MFTLDACCHGGTTELEEAELTTGWGKALSGRRIQDQALAATRKRDAHRLTNETNTKFRNKAAGRFRNESRDDGAAIA
jgi:hypothetical protein